MKLRSGLECESRRATRLTDIPDQNGRYPHGLHLIYPSRAGACFDNPISWQRPTSSQQSRAGGIDLGVGALNGWCSRAAAATGAVGVGVDRHAIGSRRYVGRTVRRIAIGESRVWGAGRGDDANECWEGGSQYPGGQLPAVTLWSDTFQLPAAVRSTIERTPSYSGFAPPGWPGTGCPEDE